MRELDFLAAVGMPARPGSHANIDGPLARTPPMTPPDLRPLLTPRSIAVIGASTQAHKPGGMPIRLLREGGYRGAIYPVHLHADEIQGLKAYPSMAAIGEAVDLAIVAV